MNTFQRERDIIIFKNVQNEDRTVKKLKVVLAVAVVMVVVVVLVVVVFCHL